MVIEIGGGRLGAWPEPHTFPNLAGRATDETDQCITQELRAAGVEMVEHDQLVDHPEVFTHFTGRLFAGRFGEFTFWRNWYYWGVKGRVPLAVAEKLYADPVGKKDVRVVGHCGCPPPEKWAVRYMPDGKKVAPLDQKEQIDHLAEVLKKTQAETDILSMYHFSDDPAVGEAFVESYHIDSQEGLDLFVRLLQEGAAA